MTPEFKKRIAKLNIYKLVDELGAKAHTDGAFDVFDPPETQYIVKELKRRISLLEESSAGKWAKPYRNKK